MTDITLTISVDLDNPDKDLLAKATEIAAREFVAAYNMQCQPVIAEVQPAKPSITTFTVAQPDAKLDVQPVPEPAQPAQPV